jgi:hypothetical protein
MEEKGLTDHPIPRIIVHIIGDLQQLQGAAEGRIVDIAGAEDLEFPEINVPDDGFPASAVS